MDSKQSDTWVLNEAGVFVPKDSRKPHVERAEFRVQVLGFQLNHSSKEA